MLKPLPVESGTIAPWFGMKGGGIQYFSKTNVETLVKQGYLELVAGPIK